MICLACCLVIATTVRAQIPPQTVRCAVVGGLSRPISGRSSANDFSGRPATKWKSWRPAPSVLAEAFHPGEADLLVMHTGDSIINLVARRAENPRPWARNDFVIVGPAADRQDQGREGCGCRPGQDHRQQEQVSRSRQ
jgi:hypothetical protein